MELTPEITVDSTDLPGMIKTMDEYGDMQYPLFGQNDEGERVMISIYHDKIIIVTYQSNHWIRKNYYYRDGMREELFDGKWS